MHLRSSRICPWAHNLCESRCRLQLSSRSQRRRNLFSSVRCDQDPKLLNALASDKCINAHKCEETVRGCTSVWFTERNRHLSVVVVGAPISMRAHSDSRPYVVFQGECWFFSELFCALSEKIEHSALTSRMTGEGTNEMPRAPSVQVSTHRALNVGCDGWEQPHDSKPGASHEVRRAGRGTAAEPSVGTTRRNASAQ